MRRISPSYRVFLYVVNLLAIGFLIAPLIPVVLGSLQSEKGVQRDVYTLLPNELARLLRTTAQQVVDYCKGGTRLSIEKELPRTYEVLTERSGAVMVESQQFVFDLLYKKNYRICVVCRKLSNGYKYDIAKQSDFVRFNIQELVADLESIEPGWTCTSTTAHSPREQNSRIEPKNLWDLLLHHINSKL